MHLRARFLLFALFLLTMTVPVRAESRSLLRCVTFNVLHGGVFSGRFGNGQDLEHRLEIVVEELQTLGVDVVGLQEASVSTGRGHVAARLAAQLGLHYVYAPASFRLFANERVNAFISRLMNFSEGPAILSRFPLVAWEAYDLPRCGRFTDARVLLCAQVQAPWGQFQVCATHISGDPCQAKRIVEVLHEQHATLPLILMGDFNATEHSPAITELIQGIGLIDTFRAANPGVPGFTVWQWVSASRPTVFRRVDYLFLRPGRNVLGKIHSSKVVLNVPRPRPDGKLLWPSDHYGVLTEVEVRSPAA